VHKKIHKYRWLIISLCWAAALVFALIIPKTKIDPDVEAMVPDKLPSRIHTNQIEDIFGGTNMIVVLLESDDILKPSTLERIEQISFGFEDCALISKTISLFTLKEIKGEQGMMLVNPAIPFIPENPEEKQTLKQLLAENDLVNGAVISDDFTKSLIIGNLQKDTDSREIMSVVDSIISAHPGPEQVYIGGFPAVSNALTKNIGKDLWILLPVALLLMIITLWFSFRDFKGVFLPFAVVVISILVAMGLMAILSWELTMVSILLPVMLIAIGNNYGIHVITRYKEVQGNHPLKQPLEHIRDVLTQLSWPVLLTAATTIAGVLGLLTHVIVPAKQVGILAAIGIFIALILSLLFIPSNLFVFKSRSRKNGKPAESKLIVKILDKISSWTTIHPKRCILIWGIITIILGAGVVKLQVEGNTLNFFDSEDDVYVSAEKIDKHFGGSQTISVLFSGDCKDPKLLQRLDHYEKVLGDHPEAGQTMSIASVIRLMSKALLDPADPGYDEIPESRLAVAQYLELYSMSGDPSDFEQLVDFNYENAHLLIRISNSSSQAVLRLVDDIKEMIDDDPYAQFVGGIGLIQAELTDNLIVGQRNSLIFALLIVSILVGLIFRSWKAGAISLIPLGSACIILFGLMGWLGIKLDAATTLLSSVMIGVGVDYTIHYLWRYRNERRLGKSISQAIHHSLTTTGKGIAYNAFTVMLGFSVLIASSFGPIRFFGFLVLVSILACFIGAIVLIPAVIRVFKPKFLDKKK